jgi:hypothetical protein
MTGHRAADDARQLAPVSARQVLADLAHLIFDDVRVLEQPLLGWRRILAAPEARGQHGVRVVDLAFYGQKPPPEPTLRDPLRWLAVRAREIGGMGDQLIGEVDLAAQR